LAAAQQAGPRLGQLAAVLGGPLAAAATAAFANPR